MAVSSSRPESIVDLKPFLARFRPTSAAGPTPPETGEIQIDFEDMVDDPPARTRPYVGPGHAFTVTWQLFLGFLAMALVIGAIVTPLILLVDPYLPREHRLLVGLPIYSASILTATATYWLVRGLAGRWLRQLDPAQALMGQRGYANSQSPRRSTAGVQATELDRLVTTVSDVVEELRYQVDTQRVAERNDLIHTITALARALEARDPHTQNHSRTVARHSVRLGHHLGLSRDMLYEIHLAGLLHDIGKIAIPDAVLMKPGRLTDAEMRQVQAHVEWSWNILSPITTLGNVGLMVRHHHERYDGQGYPDRLSGRSIPLGARIIAVTDMFVAMTEDRPYRKGLSVDVALAELTRVAGTQVDPGLVARFLDCLEQDGLYVPSASAKRAAAN